MARETIGQGVVKIIADGSGFDKQVEDQMEGAAKKGTKSFNDVWMEELKESLDEQDKLRLDHEKALQKKLANQSRGFHAQLTKNTKVIAEELAKSMDWSVEVDRTSNAIVDLQEELDKGFIRMRRWGQEIDAFQTSFDRLGRRVRRIGIGDFFRRNEEDVHDFDVRINHLRHTFDTLGDAIGTTFGRGSRNNFLNFIGSVIGNVTRLPGLLAKAGGGFIGFGTKVVTAFDDANGGAGGLASAMSVIVGRVGTVGAGLSGLTILVGTFTTALLLAGGAVLALASSLSFALVGAIGLVAGAMVPLVAGVGTAILAFANMDKATKKTFEGVKEAFGGLGDTAADELFAGAAANAETLEGVIKGLNPLVRELSRAVRDVFDGWIDGVASKEFQTFQSFVADTLPNMIRSLGEIAGNVGQALAGIWISATPFVQEFLGWLAGVTEEFANFATSAAGQEKITGFFTKVSESVKAVADFLSEAVDLLFVFLDAGKGAGDEMFRDIADQLGKWADHLRENPEILRQFFEDAQEFAGALGNAVVQAGKLIDALDTPLTRGLATFAVESLGGLLSVITKLVTAFGDLGIAIGLAALAWPQFSRALQSSKDNMVTFASQLQNTQGRMALLKTSAKELAGIGGLAALGSGLATTAREGTSFSNVLQNVAGGAGIGLMFGPMGALIGAGAGLGLTAVTAAFSDAGDAAEKTRLELMKAEGWKQAQTDADALSQALIGVVNNYGEVSRAATKASFFDEKGNLDQGIAKLREMGFSMDTIISATQGSAEAQSRIQRQLAIDLDVTKTAYDEAAAAALDARDGVVVYTDAMGRQQTLIVGETAPTLKEYEAELARTKKEYEDTAAAADEYTHRVEENTGAIESHRQQMEGLAQDLNITLRRYKSFPKEVRTKFEAEGLPQTRSDAIRLIGQYKQLQNFKNIKAVISAPGVDLTRQDVKKLVDQYNLTPRERKTLLKLEGLLPVKQGLKDVEDQAKAVEDSDPDVKVTAQTSGASSAITGIQTQLNNLPESKTVTVQINTRGGVRGGAAGGMFFGPEIRLIGEAGPEALVPLDRPLSQVDPAVRELSAVAQGLATFSGAVGRPSPSERPINIQVITPTKDPRAVATEVVNRLVPIGY